MKPSTQRRVWLIALRWLIAVIVVVALVVMVRGMIGELRGSDLDLRNLRWEWLLAGFALYALGMLPGFWYWFLVLREFGQRADLRHAGWAFFVSQLGKYVPGKGMVVVMRTAVISGPNVRPTVAATSVFVETLGWMAVGSTIGSALLAVRNPQQGWVVALGVGFAVAALIAVSPPVLALALQWIGRIRNGWVDTADVARLRYTTMIRGWLLMVVGWVLVGTSLWAVLQAVPGPAVEWSHWVLALECVTLSVVIGFASMLPGGLGVRELVMVPLLAPVFGGPKALASAVLVRLLWLMSELALAGIMHVVGARRRQH